MKTTIKVGVVALNKKNQLLLIKEKYLEVDGYKWNLIKGTYDDANESLEECAKRELQEEAGLIIDVDNFQLKEVYNYGSDNNPKMLFIFYVFNVDHDNEHRIASFIDQKSRGENIVSSRWFSLQESRKLKENDFVAKYIYLTLKNLWLNLESPDISKVKFHKIA